MRRTREELPGCGDLEIAVSILAGHRPRNESQARTRAAMLDFIEAHPRDAHLRSLLVGHLTASALVLDARGQRALLTHHKKLGRWLQLGGHCDGDANLPGVALREACEESGIEDLAIDPTPIDLDIHVIPARASEPEHLHLDTRFLVWAPPGSRETPSEESSSLGWFAPHEIDALDTDDSVRRLFRIAFAQRWSA